MTSLPGHGSSTACCARHLLAGLVLVFGALVGFPASAQDWYLVQGIIDAETYDTDTGSPRLTRNDGNPAFLGRLQLWTAFQLSPSLQFFAQGQIETDNFEGYGETGTDLEQVALRYSRQSAPWLLIEAGKVLSPLATYSDRRLSTRNPLIGQPYLYSTGYPWGARVAGTAGWFDYQAAWINPSDSGSGYQAIEPGSAYRPALGAGVTPVIGLRFGLSWTQGPYLNPAIEDYLPRGGHWRDYEQRVLGFEFQFSRGYLEFNGQLLRTRHEVPYRGALPADSTYYLELKYTWTPRLYGAVRYEDVEATYVNYPYSHRWRAETSKFRALEVGLGYRFSPDLLLKVAYQADHWDDSGYDYTSSARGRALGVQLSWFVDFVSLFSDEP